MGLMPDLYGYFAGDVAVTPLLFAEVVDGVGEIADGPACFADDFLEAREDVLRGEALEKVHWGLA